MNITIINGPNLNMLGTREPEIYGAMALQDIEEKAGEKAKTLGQNISFFQSNHEGELVEYIQNLCLVEDNRARADAIIINAGAYTHTSVAIHDALKGFSGKIIELHISNPMAREAFRHTSYIAPVATAVMAGFGWRGYLYALEELNDLSRSN